MGKITDGYVPKTIKPIIIPVKNKLMVFFSTVLPPSIHEMKCVKDKWNLYGEFLIYIPKTNDCNLSHETVQELWLYYFNRLNMDTMKFIFCFGNGSCFNEPIENYFLGIINFAKTIKDIQIIDFHIPITEKLNLTNQLKHKILNNNNMAIEFKLTIIPVAFDRPKVIDCLRDNKKNISLCKKYMFLDDNEKINRGLFMGLEEEEFENDIIHEFNGAFQKRDYFIILLKECIPNKETMDMVYEIIRLQTLDPYSLDYKQILFCLCPTKNANDSSIDFKNVVEYWKLYFQNVQETLHKGFCPLFFRIVPDMNDTFEKIENLIEIGANVIIISDQYNKSLRYQIVLILETRTKYIKAKEIITNSTNLCLIDNCENFITDRIDTENRRYFQETFQKEKKFFPNFPKFYH